VLFFCLCCGSFGQISPFEGLWFGVEANATRQVAVFSWYFASNLWQFNDPESFSGSFTYNSNTADFQIITGSITGLCLGIYAFDSTKNLRICAGLPDQVRPTSLDDCLPDGYELYTLIKHDPTPTIFEGNWLAYSTSNTILQAQYMADSFVISDLVANQTFSGYSVVNFKSNPMTADSYMIFGANVIARSIFTLQGNNLTSCGNLGPRPSNWSDCTLFYYNKVVNAVKPLQGFWKGVEVNQGTWVTMNISGSDFNFSNADGYSEGKVICPDTFSQVDAYVMNSNPVHIVRSLYSISVNGMSMQLVSFGNETRPANFSEGSLFKLNRMSYW